MAKKRTRKQKQKARQKRREQPLVVATKAEMPPTIPVTKNQPAVKPVTADDNTGPIVKDLLKTVWIAAVILGLLLAIYLWR